MSDVPSDELYQQNGVWWVRGQMYWPVKVEKGKREWIEHEPAGTWCRPASDEEIREVKPKETKGE